LRATGFGNARDLEEAKQWRKENPNRQRTWLSRDSAALFELQTSVRGPSELHEQEMRVRDTGCVAKYLIRPGPADKPTNQETAASRRILRTCRRGPADDRHCNADKGLAGSCTRTGILPGRGSNPCAPVFGCSPIGYRSIDRIVALHNRNVADGSAIRACAILGILGVAGSTIGVIAANKVRVRPQVGSLAAGNHALPCALLGTGSATPSGKSPGEYSNRSI